MTISPRTANAIWRYLATRPDSTLDEPLFAAGLRSHMDRTAVAKMLRATADRAGVSNIHPHRFRHTFAINFLRNGGDVYSLQDMLGHTTLDMVRRYLHLAQVDLDKSHRRASPVENWQL